MKKYVFVLKNINVDKIDTTYKLSIYSNIGEPSLQPLGNVTNVEDLISFDKNEMITYFDEIKVSCICVITMLNINNNRILPKNTSINCFWCKNPHKWIPIGCPIRYVNNQIKKKYKSDITGDLYELHENIATRDLTLLKESKNNDIEISGCDVEYYETYGMFCSFNCVLAFIKDNKHNSFYMESENLLINMLHDMTGNIARLIPAPHWTLLSDYGGTMTIDDFRDSFNKIEYISSNIHISPLGMVFEKKSYL